MDNNPPADGSNNARKKGGASPNQLYKDAKRVYKVAQKAVKIVRLVGSFSTWGWPLIALLFVSLFFLFFMLFVPVGKLPQSGPYPSVNLSDGSDTSIPAISGFTLSLTGDSAVGNGVPITYTITYSYDPSQNNNVPIDQISIYDDLPANTTFGTTSGKSTQTGNTIEWALSDAANASTISFTLKPTSDDINVSNYVYAKTAGVIGSSDSVPPSDKNCNDPGYQQYMDANPTHQNYGDPDCEVDNALTNPTHRDTMYSYVKSIDPTYADIWFKCIAYGESRWDPNAFTYPDPSSGLDPAGSWGLFQMGRGLNGQYDHGDVDWRQQVQNAVNDNNLRQAVAPINRKFAYWVGEIGGYAEDGTLTCINGLTPPGGF